MATHSSVLAWRIPGTEEPGRLPSMGSHRVGHNWGDLAVAASFSNIGLPMWLHSKNKNKQTKNLPMQETQETWVRSLGWEDPLEGEMAPHSRILAWKKKIPWTEEPGGATVPAQRVGMTDLVRKQMSVTHGQVWERLLGCTPVVILPSKGHRVMYGGSLSLQAGTEDATCSQWVEARDAANVLRYKGLIQSTMSVALRVRNATLHFGSVDLTCVQPTCRGCAVN